jgi:hypothetical protein
MNKKIFLIIGGVLVIALLAGGAFMAMRLLNQKPPETAGGANGGRSLQLQTGGGPGGGSQRVSIKIIPSKALPQQTPDLEGLVVRTQDNSLFVGKMQNMMVTNINGKISTSPTPEGPYTEVVISQESKVYRDVTMNQMPDPSKTSSGGTTEVQQQLEAGSLSDAVAGNSHLQVWGQKRGDRLIADVVVIEGMAVMKGGPSK